MTFDFFFFFIKSAITTSHLFLQVRDFFDVKDDPVLGFSPPAVVTVFHTHVWEGTIDYRFVVEFFCCCCSTHDVLLSLLDSCSGAQDIKSSKIVLEKPENFRICTMQTTQPLILDWNSRLNFRVFGY